MAGACSLHPDDLCGLSLCMLYLGFRKASSAGSCGAMDLMRVYVTGIHIHKQYICLRAYMYMHYAHWSVLVYATHT